MAIAPLISIVIPTRNRRELLREALASLSAQSYVNWEVWVVDDGSDDATDRLVAGFAERDARVKWTVRRGPDGGAQVCRNQGLAAARGRYVVFMDSDDLLAPHCLEGRGAALERDSALHFVVGGTECFDHV